MSVTIHRLFRTCLVLSMIVMLLGVSECQKDSEYYVVKVVDAKTGEPIPGVKLWTLHRIEVVTDEGGNAVFFEPGLMSRKIRFMAEREGYQAPNLLFGAGYDLLTKPGATDEVTMTRVSTEPFNPQNPPAGPDTTSKAGGAVPQPEDLFGLEFVDATTGRGVPLIEVQTSGGERLWTDNNGWVAIERFVEGQSLNVEVYANGYRYDGQLGNGKPGETVIASAGGRRKLTVVRDNIAERLYRVTGAGQYHHSANLGEAIIDEKGNYNAAVLGSDSVLTTVYKGKLFWVWGDTRLAESPIFTFRAPGATSELPQNAPHSPLDWIRLNYFVDATEQAVGLAPKVGPGAMWLGGLVSVFDHNNEERLFARYSRHKDGARVGSGLLRWNDATERFEKIHDNAADGDFPGMGQPIKITVNNADYVYIGRNTRVAATPEAFVDPSAHEVFSPIDPVTRKVEYLWDGVTPNFQWRKETTVATNAELSKETHPWGHVHDIDSGKSLWVSAAGGPWGTEGRGRGRAQWNEHRKRFVWTFQTVGSGSSFGETYYMEADTPLGPWVYARKIVTHAYDGYSFYNPRHHPYLSPDTGRTILFEATYTTLLTEITDFTPRYAYNQVMYQVDTEDERLVLPVPVYQLSGSPGFATKANLPGGKAPRQVAFFALDRPRSDAIAVCAVGDKLSTCASGKAVFYALPANAGAPNSDVVDLWEYTHSDASKKPVYVTDSNHSGKPGYVRSTAAIVKVWRKPMTTWFWPERYLPRADGSCCD